MTLDGFDFDGALTGAGSGVTMIAGFYIEIVNCSFRNYGLGIYFSNNAWVGSSQIGVRRTMFQNNGTAAASPGSGMLTSSVFEDCTFAGNGVGYNSSNWGDRDVTFSRCRFEGNQYGVILEGVYWYWLKTARIAFQRCIFASNDVGLVLGDLTASAYNGSAFSNSVVNSDFVGNTTAGLLVNTNFDGTNSGTPAYYDSLGQTITNSIFAGNGVGVDNWQGRTLFASYNLAWANALDGQNLAFDSTTASLVADPLFVGAAAGDFRLAAGSPAIDAGNPAYDSDPELYGAHIDIGALEARPPAPAEMALVLAGIASGVPETYLRNKNNSIPLSRKLYEVWTLVLQADAATDPVAKADLYRSALSKTERDVIAKSDGCALTGAPDRNDWITSCAVQEDFYGPAQELAAMLRSLLAP